MKLWPPKPGLTVMTRTMSTSSTTSSRVLTGVAGLMATDALRPAAWMSWIRRFAWSVASMWKVTLSAPASMKAAIISSGLVIMRWTSTGRSVARLVALRMSSPKEMFGTKCPSITS